MRSKITKNQKKRCRNRARIWRRKILRKRSLLQGWRRGRWSPEPRIRRFRREFGKNRPVKILNTPEPAYGRGRRILRAKAPCRQPPRICVFYRFYLLPSSVVTVVISWHYDMVVVVVTQGGSTRLVSVAGLSRRRVWPHTLQNTGFTCYRCLSSYHGTT